MAFRSRFRHRSRPRWRKFADGAVAFAVIALVALAAAHLERWTTEEMSGPVRVVDGDSLEMGERRLRLKGIDAPELRQNCRREGFEYPCGTEAASQLRGLIAGNPVSCLSEGLDRYRRDLVRCTVNGREINRAMVRSGHAVAFGDYRQEEDAARAQAVGLWAGDFDLPKEWRAIHGGLGEEMHGGLNALRAVFRRLSGSSPGFSEQP